ncbi:MAG: glycoside hydrolase domain-containing protein [Candidatus Hydrogenedentota bacterium]
MLKSILTVSCWIAMLPVCAQADEPDALLDAVAAFDAVAVAVDDAAFAGWLKEACDAVRADYSGAAERCADAESRLERRACIKGEQQAARGRLTRLQALVGFHAEALDSGCPEAYGVGIATGMDKVMPRALDLPVRVGEGASIAAARREKEAFQVVVAPWQGDLEEVQVEVAALKNNTGDALPEDAVSVSAMGYVKTEKPSRYPVDFVGWWPDPLLDFLDTVDVAQGDAQSFWVRVAVPKDQPAGAYRGEAVVSAKNAASYAVPVEVRVYDFTLPVASPLRTAITVTDNHVSRYGDWETLKFQYADLLAEYYIDLDHSYRRAPADFEVVRYLEQKGVLRAFNLANIHKSELVPSMDEAAFEKAMTMIEDRIRPAYEQAKEHGVLDKAYIYGFDEVGDDYFPVVQKVAKRLDALFPEPPLLTTTYDDTYGFESGATAVDGWIPLTPRYDPEQAAAARAKGREVWWYICCGPIHPYANFLIEYPAIEARLLMGAMTAKYRPDGFLYYKITRWPHEDDKPITGGPFVDWNPASYRDYNGDGSLLCPGEGGRPLPTIRLENFRDGLEDYAYVRILEERIVAVEEHASRSDQAKAWLEQAKAALEVPRPVVTNLREYTYDPTMVYAWRNRLAAAIESVPEA